MMNQTYQFQDAAIQAADPIVYNAECAPFNIHGIYRSEDGLFVRMPREIAEQTGRRVGLLYANTAGGRLRFATDSSFIALGAICPPMTFSSPRSALLSGAGACCFDLYVDGKHCRVLDPQTRIQRGSVMGFEIPDGRYEALADLSEKKMRQITVCFPSFINVSQVFIGLERDATVQEAVPYVNQLPVVLYGSSITQGACASRAGNTYPNILSRRFGFDYVNLGFAGACKAEDEMIGYLCDLPMQLLVYDYDHNTPSVEYLRQTHLPGLQRLRQAHPHIPIILMSKPNCHNGKDEALRRMRVIEESYEALRKESDAPVHFVNGQEIFEGHDPEMMTMDNTHPTDLGFYCMAEALSEIFKLYF